MTHKKKRLFAASFSIYMANQNWFRISKRNSKKLLG